jgi:hypothetical protein
MTQFLANGGALGCSFCGHVFHNTTECIGADIASPDSRVAGTGGALGVLGVLEGGDARNSRPQTPCTSAAAKEETRAQGQEIKDGRHRHDLEQQLAEARLSWHSGGAGVSPCEAQRAWHPPPTTTPPHHRRAEREDKDASLTNIWI